MAPKFLRMAPAPSNSQEDHQIPCFTDGFVRVSSQQLGFSSNNSHHLFSLQPPPPQLPARSSLPSSPELPRGMKAVDVYSRTGCLDDSPPDTILELLSFKFCCEGLKAACDAKLAALIRSTDDALLLVDYALEGTAHVLMVACLQSFLRDLPFPSSSLPQTQAVAPKHSSKLLASDRALGQHLSSHATGLGLGLSPPRPRTV